MSSNRTLALLVAFGALSLGACATPAPRAADNTPVARLPTEQYPLAVTETPQELLLAPHDVGLSPAQRDALVDFAARWRSSSTSGAVIEASTYGGAAAYSTSHEAAELLSDHGVPVRVIGYEAAPEAPVRVSFLTAEAEVYDCNRSWDRLTATHSNGPQRNFGCALSANRAAMIADAADIVRPRAEDPSDASRRQAVTEKYRRGEVTSSVKDDQGSVNSSRAVN